MSKTFARKFNTYILGDLIILKKYGHIFLDDSEYKSTEKAILRKYYKSLAKNVFKRREKAFWEYHRKGLKEIGHPIRAAKLAKASAFLLFNKVIDAFKIQ
jgi:hypothetical protein